MSLYRLEGVRKGYGGRTVLDIEALTVHAGEVLVVVGPSGAGKSTLLRLLAFLEPPDAGRIHYDGRVIPPGGAPLDVRREVTLVFQRTHLISTTVARNVALGLRLRGQHVSRESIHQALADLGLNGLGHRHAHTLSGGEARRVALARAAVLRPRVLLLDEPTADLDPANVQQVERWLRAVRRIGTTIVLVTHNIFQARRLADRVALLLDGQIVEIAPSRRFFQSPQDPRTAAFVRGEMIC